MVSIWDWSTQHSPVTSGPTVASRPTAVRFWIDFWRGGWSFISSLEIGLMNLSVYGLRPRDWPMVIPGIAVSLGAIHSDSLSRAPWLNTNHRQVQKNQTKHNTVGIYILRIRIIEFCKFFQITVMGTKDLGILVILPAILLVIRQAILLVIRQAILLVICQAILLVIRQEIQGTSRQIPKVPPLEIPREIHLKIPEAILQIRRMTKASRTRSQCQTRWTWVWRCRTSRWRWTSPWTRTSNRISRSSWTAGMARYRGRHLATGMWVDDVTSWISIKMIVAKFISWWQTDPLYEKALEVCLRVISITPLKDFTVRATVYGFRHMRSGIRTAWCNFTGLP